MAYDLEQHFAGLTTHVPGQPSREFGYYSSEQHDQAEDDLRIDRVNGECGSGSGSESASEEQDSQEEVAVVAKSDPTTATNTFDNTPTPPINVPNQLWDHSDTRRHDSRSAQQSRYHDGKPYPNYTTKRRTFISFDPEVKLDGGDRTTLDGPLPKLSVSTRPRGRSLLEEISKREMKRELSRARSDTDREEYDPVTGERLDAPADGRRDKAYTASQPRWPLLQSTVDELAAHQLLGPEVRVTLNSQGPASPVGDMLEIPLSFQGDSSISALSISSPSSRPEWFPVSSLDSPRRLKSASRSQSYGVDRKASRRLSRRSTSNSVSPASAFLSKYLPVDPLPSPDAEGQEVGDYVLGREIGFGGFSTIREAYTFSNGKRLQRAVKIVRRQVTGKEDHENEALQAEFEHEVSLWRCLSHRHILPLFAVYVSDFATFAITQLNTGGTLFDAVRSNRTGLLPRFARRYAYQTASALRYLHEDVRIVHRDLKLENCLLDMSAPDAAETGANLMLCDFGLADYISSETATVSKSRSSFGASSPPGGSDFKGPSSPLHAMGPSDTSTNFSGSLPYAAPELLHQGRGNLDPKTDIWAFGIIAYAIVTGQLPFAHAYAPMVRAKILGGEWDRQLLESRESGAFPAAVALLEDDRGAAATADLMGVGNLVTRCLEMNPRRRWDVRDCLGSKWLETERHEEDMASWGN